MNPLADTRKKLSREDVRTIRFLWDRGLSTARALATAYGVSPEHIALIVRGYRRAKVSHA